MKNSFDRDEPTATLVQQSPLALTLENPVAADEESGVELSRPLSSGTSQDVQHVLRLCDPFELGADLDQTKRHLIAPPDVDSEIAIAWLYTSGALQASMDEIYIATQLTIAHKAEGRGPVELSLQALCRAYQRVGQTGSWPADLEMLAMDVSRRLVARMEGER